MGGGEETTIMMLSQMDAQVAVEVAAPTEMVPLVMVYLLEDPLHKAVHTSMEYPTCLEAMQVCVHVHLRIEQKLPVIKITMTDWHTHRQILYACLYMYMHTEREEEEEE